MEVGVLEGFGIDIELAVVVWSPFGGTIELGGMEVMGDEQRGCCESLLSLSLPFFAFSSVIPLILSISATLSRDGSSS